MNLCEARLTSVGETGSADVSGMLIDHLDLWTSAVTTRSTAGRGRNGKIELTGIKKLRELILELAVRGKLVDQDPSDEPASVLLERVAEEKARLVKEGRIKKPKKLPEITEEAVTAKLPTAWTWTRLGEITNYGVTDKAEPDEVEDTTWVLELEDIEKESSRLIQRVTYRDRQFKSSKNRFLVEDVLYGKLRPYLDKVIVADMQGVCTTEIIPIRAFEGVFPAYLRLALKSPTFKQYAKNSTHGMNLPRLGTDKARLALIPLPPKDEQCRIVEKVDELMALCDRLEQQVGDQLEAHEVLVDTLLGALIRSIGAAEVAENWARIAEHFDTLFTTEASIDKLKQTILQLAIMGRLVPQDHNDEPASVLLERIAEEKARLVKEGKIRKGKSLPEIKEDQKYFPLPISWQWVMLGKIQTFTNGFAFKSNDFSEHGVGVIRIGDVSRDGRVTPNDMKFIPEEIASTVDKQFFVNPGELVITMTGDVKPGINYSESSYLLNQRVGKLTPHIVSRDFLYIYLKTVAKEKIDNAFGGVIPNVSTKDMNESVIGLPPLNEQHRIVEKVDELMTLCDRLKARLGEAGETRTHLAEVVVEQAVS